MAHKFTDTTGIQHLWKKVLKSIANVKSYLEQLASYLEYKINTKANSSDVYTKDNTYSKLGVANYVGDIAEAKANLYNDTDLTSIYKHTGGTVSSTGITTSSKKWYLVLNSAGKSLIPSSGIDRAFGSVYVIVNGKKYTAYSGNNSELVVTSTDNYTVYECTYSNIYDVEDVYTNTYTKSEVDAKITSGGSFDSTLYYTKTETDDTFATLDSLATVATSGEYDDLSNTPEFYTEDEVLQELVSNSVLQYIEWEGDSLTYTLNDTEYTTTESPVYIDETITSLSFSSSSTATKVKLYLNLNSCNKLGFGSLANLNTNLVSIDLGFCSFSSNIALGTFAAGLVNLLEIKFPTNLIIYPTNMLSMFGNCTSLETVDLSSFNYSSITSSYASWAVFMNCASLKTIVAPNFTFGYNSFVGCTSLQNIVGPLATISTTTDVKYSPLTRESALLFLNALAETTTSKTITFSKTTYDLLTESDLAIATDKGWTVAYDESY